MRVGGDGGAVVVVASSVSSSIGLEVVVGGICTGGGYASSAPGVEKS